MRADLKRVRRDTSSGHVAAESGSAQAIAAADSGKVSPAQISSISTQVPVARRLPRAAIAATVIVLLAAAGFAAYRLLNRHRGLNLQNMEITKLTDSGKASMVAISPDGQYVVYVKRDADQQSLWMRHVATKSDVQILPPDLVSFAGLSFSPDGNYIYFVRSDKSTQNYNYLYTMPVLGGSPRQLIRDIDSPVSFSPDGKQFVFMRGIPDSDVIQLRIAGAEDTGDRLLAQLPAYAGAIFGASWSPDGKSVAVSTLQVGKQVRWVLIIVQTADGTLKLLYSSPDFLGRPVWLPGGSSLLVPIGLPKENRNQIWEISYPAGQRERFTNDLSNYTAYFDLTRDRSALVALDQKQTSHIWIVTGAKSDLAREIASGGRLDQGVVPGPGNKLLLQSEGSKLVSMNSDGTDRNVLIPQLQNYLARSTCGDRYLVFDSYNGSKLQLMRSDSDGSNAVKLSDDVAASQCSPDGMWLIYQSREKIYRLLIDGGAAPVEIASASGGADTVISADGKFVAFTYQEGTPVPQSKAAIIPAQGGPTLHVFTLPTGVGTLRWSPDGKALHYLLTRNGATNVWEQSLSGGNPRQFTHFTSGLIFDFSWSRDGKQLLLSKGDQSSDVVLITNFR